ncbi:Lrp/AsnC family transcriptional regulator [Streptomyces sp. NPDC050145]|uniref:Lrp/AsnC family transcriptional regulator n=1 Tax=Streptomyces sp. NPDC050145 TaxID=3365602 RepID=UPI0037ABCD77
MLDPTDERLIHALQIEPRASWTDLAPVVGVDAATLGRRWNRLRDEGIVWVTGFRPRRQLAMIEIECAPDQIDATARELEQDRAVWVLDFCSGARDLLAIVSFDDLSDLSEYALRRLGEKEGLRGMRTHPVNEILVDAANWRLRALTPEEAARVRPPRGPRARAARLVADDLREAIEAEVWRDGRVAVTAIAERHGFSPQRVADALATLRRGGELLFRTDLAREVSGWPVYTWYFVEASARTIETVRTALGTVPEVRLAFTSPSRYNLILAVWLRRLADVNRFEMALGAALPDSRIADRSVVLSMRKHMAQIIGPDTRSRGYSGDV